MSFFGQVFLKNIAKAIINPATEEKQDRQIAAQLDSDQVDGVSNAVMAIDYQHHEMHEGSHYFIKTYILDTGAVASTTFFAFTSPVAPVRVHAKAILAPDLDFTVNIYEGSVITGGTPVVGVNNDRDSVNVAGLVAVAAPAHTTPGTVIWSARTGGGKNPVGVAPGANYEIIAAADTIYVFELIKNVANNGIVDIDFFWYEHTDSRYTTPLEMLAALEMLSDLEMT